MTLEPVLVPRRIIEMRGKGLWTDHTLWDYLLQALQHCPEKVAVIDHAGTSSSPRKLTYRELATAAANCAESLTELGVRHNDVVSIQLPNCWEYFASILACSKIGAVVNPLMPIFRERELEFMLNFCEAKVLLVPATWRGRDHAAMVRALLPRLPRLQHLVVCGEPGDQGVGKASFANRRTEPDFTGARIQKPDEVALLMYTSGTTGEPKGVMHTSNTMLSTLRTAIDELQVTPNDIALCAAPMGHMVGLALLGMLPLMAGATTVIMESWDVNRALALMHQERITFTAGATPFLADLCDTVAAGAVRPPALRLFCCAGAPIPPVLIERAANELSMTVCSLWGMTEVQAGTITGVKEGSTYSAIADGRPPRGMETKIVNEHGASLGIGQTGRLLVRGCGLFAGYLKRPDLNGVDDEGWFDTGDLAFLVNEEGYIRINGRTKDIIKRGGESVPVVEVEALLARHPAVSGVAIVGWPDERLGERVCAFVTLNPGRSLDLHGVSDYLKQCKLTPQYWPERIEVCEELPRTTSGKVQKFKLRELARQRAASGH